MSGVSDSYKTEVIEPGAKASQRGYQTCVDSFGNCQAIEVVMDSRPEWQKEVGFVFKPHINADMNERVVTPGGVKPVMWQIPTTDGGGHKPEINTAIGTPEAFMRLGADLLVMMDHDILRRGGKPCVCTNFYDAKAITEENFPLLDAYFTGLDRALCDGQVTNLTGESAIVRYAVTAFCDRDLSSQLILNVAGTCIGIAHVDKHLDGSKIGLNMPIVACLEKGGRCNGFTKLIDIILAYFGPKFYQDKQAMQLLEMLSVSSQSYSRSIQRIHGWNSDGTIKEPLAEIVGMFHITGGGIWEKLRLPPGIGAILDNMPQPPESLTFLQELSWWIPRLQITDHQAYGTLNGGIGYATILATEEDARIFVAECAKDGVAAQRIGKTVARDSGEILITESRFRQGKELSSLRPV